MRNIRVVDDIVMRTEKLFGEFFNDDKTAFVFTADHGMSNIGNHGDGRMWMHVNVFDPLFINEHLHL